MQKEIGSFIELDISGTGEYFQCVKNTNIARLNSGRAAICHAVKLLEVKKVWLPYYICPSVENALQKERVECHFYEISEDLLPKYENRDSQAGIIVVNYFGILSSAILRKMISPQKNCIIDNSQAFYTGVQDSCYNVYSPRKFFGVPDGGYLIGENAQKDIKYYDKDFSSGNADFLLKRHEFGSSAVYPQRMENEERLEHAGRRRMSDLTKILLSGIDYETIKYKRLINFLYASLKLDEYNLIDTKKYFDKSCVPMVYPLVVRNDSLVDILKANNIYTGRWWNHVKNTTHDNMMANKLSRFMVPLPIDQRYTFEEIDLYSKIIKQTLKNAS